LGAPEIITQPQDTTISAGNPATFSVGVIGATPLYYQWRKEGVAILNATNQSYTIPSVAAGDAGNYSVLITNVFGSAISSNAVLTIACNPVSIVGQPATPRNVGFGRSVNLVVSINQTLLHRLHSAGTKTVFLC